MSQDSEQLKVELKALAETIEAMLGHSTAQSKDEIARLRGRIELMLQNTREQLGDAKDRLAEQTKMVADKADNYVHDNPWTGIGVGAAIGLVLGILLAKR